MKKSFFGLSAKLAMAVFAVGAMLTSCYDKEEVPAVIEPSYFVTGSVYDVESGSMVSNFTYSINSGANQTSTTGSFKAELAAPGTVTVRVSADGYIDAVKTAEVVKVGNGQIGIAQLDFALAKIPATATPVSSTNVEATSALASGAGFPTSSAIEDGKIVVTDEIDITSGAAVVEIPYNKYAGLINVNADPKTKSEVTVAEIGQLMANNLGLVYKGTKYADFAKEAATAKFSNVHGVNVVNAVLKTTFTVTDQVYRIGGADYYGTAVYPTYYVVTVNYESHDSHGDSHSGSEDVTNAGGGAGSAE